jgi:hypothetical protein
LENPKEVLLRLSLEFLACAFEYTSVSEHELGRFSKAAVTFAKEATHYSQFSLTRRKALMMMPRLPFGDGPISDGSG